MLLNAAAAALVLTLVTPAFAQEPTPIDVAILTCVGPGYTPDGDPFEVLDAFDERSCTRVCKASAVGCKAVVKAIDKCGVSFLKASAKVSIEVCRGWGYTAAECRGINAEAKADIDWWKAQGRIERDECDSEAATWCLSRCQSPVGVNFEDLVPAPLPERPEGQAGGAIHYLDFGALDSSAEFSESLTSGFSETLSELPEGSDGQAGSRVVASPGVEVVTIGERP